MRQVNAFYNHKLNPVGIRPLQQPQEMRNLYDAIRNPPQFLNQTQHPYSLDLHTVRKFPSKSRHFGNMNYGIFQRGFK